jgi:hypothetical protein
MLRMRLGAPSKGAKGNRNKPHISFSNGKWKVTMYCPWGIRNLKAEGWAESMNGEVK